MDQNISAILDEYHALIRQQQDGNEAPAPDGRDRLLRAVGPDTGRLINILARSLPRPKILEIGTSFGYSGIWLAEAARASGGRVVTLELHDYKSAFAQDMATKAGLADYIDFKIGDALAIIETLPFGFDFVLLDLWKDLYVPCLEAFYPKLNAGAIIVADNMIRPATEDVKHYAKAVRAKPDIASVLLPVGSGIEVSRFKSDLV
ncbi:MAG: class I SAM-dependent methyltransferase [Pseudomonadota bacterium]